MYAFWISSFTVVFCCSCQQFRQRFAYTYAVCAANSIIYLYQIILQNQMLLEKHSEMLQATIMQSTSAEVEGKQVGGER